MDNLASHPWWAMFVEARKDGARCQWVLFPPEREGGRQRFIKRRLDRPGHRAKWSTTERPGPYELETKLGLELAQYESTGWELKEPVVIALEEDDYEKVWAGETVKTPYKALRHVSKWTKLRGYDV